MTMSSRCCTLASIALLTASGALYAQNATVVYLDTGGAVREAADVVIVQDSLRGVRGRRQAAQLTWAPDRVQSIKWRQGPAAYKRGINAFEDGEFATAARSLAESLEGNIDQYKWLPVYANAYLGRAHARLGEAEAALAALEKALAADPESRFVPDIYELQAELFMNAGNTAKARAALEKMREATRGLDASYGIRADIGLARVEIRGGDARKAINSLQGLLPKVSSEPRLMNLVRMEVGNAYVKLGEFAQAESNFRGILDSKASSDPEVLSGASNGLGDAQFEQDLFSEAVESYSRTFAWFHDRPDLRAQVGWALYRCGLALESKAGLQTDAAERDLSLRYSRRLLSRAAREYRDTRGGGEAARKLGR